MSRREWLNPAVIDDVDLPGTYKHILRLTTAHAGPGGCWPTRACIAEKASCSLRTVSRAWAAGEKLGILQRRVNAGAPDRDDLGGRRPNLIVWAEHVWEKGRRLWRERRDRATQRRIAAKAKAKAKRRQAHCQPTPATGVNQKFKGRSVVTSESLVTSGDARERSFDELRVAIGRPRPAT